MGGEALGLCFVCPLHSGSLHSHNSQDWYFDRADLCHPSRRVCVTERWIHGRIIGRIAFIVTIDFFYCLFL